jgi:hypothetical protein
VPQEHAQFVEKRFLHAVDDWASRALVAFLKNIVERATMEQRLKVGWARFLYSLMVRNPEQVMRLQQRSDENAPELIDNLRDAPSCAGKTTLRHLTSTRNGGL